MWWVWWVWWVVGVVAAAAVVVVVLSTNPLKLSPLGTLTKMLTKMLHGTSKSGRPRPCLHHVDPQLQQAVGVHAR